jgi:hypothetical protein
VRGEGSALVDPLNPDGCEFEFSATQFGATTVTANLPMHGATFDSIDVTSGELIGSAFLTPAEVYTTTNSPVPISQVSWAEDNMAMSVVGNEIITIEVSGSCVADTDVIWRLIVQNDQGTPAIVTLGTDNFTAGAISSSHSAQFGNASGKATLSGVTFNMLIGVVVQQSGTGGIGAWNINYDSIRVVYVANPLISIATASGSGATFQPFSRWNGQAVPSLELFSKPTNSYRNIASSLLVSDLTSNFQVGGLISAAQVKSRHLPAESGILGFTGIGEYSAQYSGPEKKGLYSAPVKINDVGTREFIDADKTWDGHQTYTVFLAYLPSPSLASSVTIQQFQIKLEVHDIFELKMGQQQIKDVSTVKANEKVLAFLESRNGLLTENPWHIGEIFNFIKGAAKQALPVIKLLVLLPVDLKLWLLLVLVVKF